MSKLKKALEKAKEDREGSSQNVFMDHKASSKSDSSKMKPIDDYRPEIDISYSETKVKKIEESLVEINEKELNEMEKRHDQAAV